MVPAVERTAMRDGEVKTLLRDDSAGRIDRNRVLANHCQDRGMRLASMRVDNPPALLSEIADGFERLLAGKAIFRDNADCLGYPVREACFDHFSIFIAGDAGSTTRV